MASSIILLCALGLACYATETSAQAQPVQTGCAIYKKIAAATPAGPPAPSQTAQLRIVSPSGPPRMGLMETPSRTIWMPKCRQNDIEYHPKQTRQLGNQPFCVFSTTGEILYDPFRTEKGRSPATPLHCECFSQVAAYDNASMMPGFDRPECDPHTGAYKSGRPMHR